MTLPLFDEPEQAGFDVHELAPGAAILRRLALPAADELIRLVAHISSTAPFRHLVTPGGYRMSVAMTNCGRLGWVSDLHGYRYDTTDPESGRPWPAMPIAFVKLAQQAAAELGFVDFDPDACLINRYAPDSRLSLHQDKDELEMRAPIVSVSLGVPALFQFGGLQRSDRPMRYPLAHGDVVVWGGPSRLRYHGVLPVKADHHPLTGEYRFNLTFRQVR